MGFRVVVGGGGGGLGIIGLKGFGITKPWARNPNMLKKGLAKSTLDGMREYLRHTKG